MKKIIFLIFLGVFALNTSASWAQGEEAFGWIQSGDHSALAKYYRLRASELKDSAAQHERMRDLYGKSHDHYKDFTTLAHHCENLRLQALQASYQYEVLAKQEEELAQQEKKKGL